MTDIGPGNTQIVLHPHTGKCTHKYIYISRGKWITTVEISVSFSLERDSFSNVAADEIKRAIGRLIFSSSFFFSFVIFFFLIRKLRKEAIKSLFAWKIVKSFAENLLFY